MNSKTMKPFVFFSVSHLIYFLKFAELEKKFPKPQNQKDPYCFKKILGIARYSQKYFPSAPFSKGELFLSYFSVSPCLPSSFVHFHFERSKPTTKNALLSSYQPSWSCTLHPLKPLSTNQLQCVRIYRYRFKCKRNSK